MLTWRPAELGDVDAMVALEQRAYSHPWTHGNFVDSIAGGHWAWLGFASGALRTFWLAMPALDELHLLNLAVDPSHWGCGLGRLALAHLDERAQAQRMVEIWLEVRVSNRRALALYRRDGFMTVGQRRGYYPLSTHQREDALVMQRRVGTRSSA